MAKFAAELQSCLHVRQVVFTKEQGINANADLDVNDIYATHFLALEDDRVIGTVRVFLEGGKAKIGRLVVLKNYRKHGVGTKLMKMAIKYAKNKKVDMAVSICQVMAISFYEKLGFKKVGKVFLQVGIPHRKMILSL